MGVQLVGNKYIFLVGNKHIFLVDNKYIFLHITNLLHASTLSTPYTMYSTPFHV